MTSPAPHETQIRVRFAELDPYGHLNHAMYSTFFEQARVEALEDIDLGLHTLVKDDLTFLVVKLNIEFKRPAMASQIVTIKTHLSEVRRATSTWTEVMSHDDTVLAVGHITAAMASMTGRPVKPPDWVMSRLTPLIILD